MKGNRKKLILDLILVLILMTLYSKNVISLMYHEVVGLALFLLFLVHMIFNRKWIIGVARNLLTSQINGRIRLMATVDILLILAWMATIVTGILVSKKIFPFHINALNPYHFFSAAVALILTGIHLGLHADYLRAAIRKYMTVPAVRKPMAILLFVLVLAVGCYSLATVGITRWIAAPFVTSEQGHANGAGEVQVSGANGQAQNKQQMISQTAGMDGETHAYGQSFQWTKLLLLCVKILACLYLFYFLTSRIEKRLF